IIVNWQSRDLLERALECLYTTIRASSFEVIVLDNSPGDGSAEMVRVRFPEAQMIVNHENVGFGRANNQGASIARGRYLLLLNPDAFVHEGTVDRLVAFMDAHPDAGAAGPRLRYGDGQLQRSVTAFPTIWTELWTTLGLDRAFPRHPVFGHYKMTYWEMDDQREVDALIGACLILRRAVIDRVGLFDEQFFMYSEEVDLCYRLRKTGWKNYFLPDVEATHLWGGSAQRVPSKTFLRLFRSRVQFFRKHYGRLNVALYKGVLLLAAITRVVAGPFLFALKRDHASVQVYLNYMALLRAIRSW
ncbi:MAG: glycosyltransferase family 2 protein, partial [Chloroflexales bacterium]|nr:glycosyltransferase family 2 protein [Chloroflexales bacterium]